MPKILTPKRRQLTRHARRILEATVNAWEWRTGATSANTMISLTIRRRMLRLKLERLAREHDRLPTGIIEVPPRLERPLGTTQSFSGKMSGFTVDLDDLRQGPPDLRNKKG